MRRHAGDVDIFCLQEVSEAMQNICRDVLSGYTELHASKPISDTTVFEQSVFVRNDLPILSSGTIFDTVMDTGLGLWCKVSFADSSLMVCNFHGIPKPGDKLDTPLRIEASRHLIEFADQHHYSAIVGDFNLLPHTASVTQFEMSGYHNLIKEHRVTNTRNWYAWDKHHADIQYFADFAFTSGNLVARQFAVLPDEVSDHLALLLDL